MSSAASNPHFAGASSWGEAAKLLEFEPLRPHDTRGLEVQSFSVHVRDHKQRELSRRSRSLEVHYGDFVLSQSRKGKSEARRWALGTSYGSNPQSVDVAGREGRMYPPGPEPEPDDIDPRRPAVVTWCDGEMFYLLASERLEVESLLEIAQSCY